MSPYQISTHFDYGDPNSTLGSTRLKSLLFSLFTPYNIPPYQISGHFNHLVKSYGRPKTAKIDLFSKRQFLPFYAKLTHTIFDLFSEKVVLIMFYDLKKTACSAKFLFGSYERRTVSGNAKNTIFSTLELFFDLICSF